MTLSIFDLLSVGIGPSSSHTVGPMKASYAFRHYLLQEDWVDEKTHITVTLYGSLAFTCHGHGTDKAILAGLEGCLPDQVDPCDLAKRLTSIYEKQCLCLTDACSVGFDTKSQLVCNLKDRMPEHSNACLFEARDGSGKVRLSRLFYSIGGGFIQEEGKGVEKKEGDGCKASIPYPFDSGQSLFDGCSKHKKTIADLMMANEMALHPDCDVKSRVLYLAEVMWACLKRGLEIEGELPGGLKVQRRAPALYRSWLEKENDAKASQDHRRMQYINLCAMAVNEENAAGGRVVTAPTNGAAGVIPAVLAYYKQFYSECTEDKVVDFLLTAAAIGFLYKKNASISGAEMGCQGEVGVASSMAAAGLTAVLGGSVVQVENAAEIAMEHHLGMTCDPVKGLVQVPCIERNAMGALKAVNAALLALSSEDRGIVSLDQIIATMYETGQNMHSMYKETSQGGLAVNVVEC